jgi:hypothetical protein
MNIRCVYSAEPDFPATAQHPDCLRAAVGAWVVDYLGTVPTLEDVEAFLGIDVKGSARAAIDAVERAYPIKHRALRELVLALGEVYPQSKTTPFYVAAKQADDAIKIERAKL